MSKLTSKMNLPKSWPAKVRSAMLNVMSLAKDHCSTAFASVKNSFHWPGQGKEMVQSTAKTRKPQLSAPETAASLLHASKAALSYQLKLNIGSVSPLSPTMPYN
jgi:hypothetical protein